MRAAGGISGRAAFFLALGVLTLGAVGGVVATAKTIYIPIPDTELKVNAGFSPKALARTKSTPITFKVSGDITSLAGAHIPALREFILESDRNVAIDVKGLPTCRAIKLRSADPDQAEASCRPAMIGSGHLAIELDIVETLVPTQGKVIVFNGGVKGGITTLYIHSYLTVPVPAVILSTVKIKKIHRGRYGLQAVTTIPKIAGGSGSVSHFDLKLYKRGVLTAKCTDGKLQVRSKAGFDDGALLGVTISRSCFPPTRDPVSNGSI
jgi:hypothetical protein